MFFRKTALSAVLALLAVAVAAGAAGAARDRSVPGTPTNLRITATTETSISLAWDASSGRSNNFWTACSATSRAVTESIRRRRRSRGRG
jgi:hypothetical protein